MTEITDIEDDKLQHKYQKLKQILTSWESALVAFSAGVDSTFLLHTAREVIGRNKVLAVTADSPIRSRAKLKASRKLAKNFGVKHRVIEMEELTDANFSRNESDRCYHCKHILYGRLLEIAQEHDIEEVLDGTNADDVRGSHRPGYQVLQELAIKTPLKSAGLLKQEIRELSRQRDLPTWNQPSDTCYATRVDYDLDLDRELIEQVRKLESLISASMEFEQLRVRIHDSSTVRIEVLPENLEKIMNQRQKIITAAREMGYNYITLDLAGYRQGSINEKNKPE